MVGEVNKIIYNMLVSGRGVYLPEIGTLYIERQAARKISADRLLSPRNVVTFRSGEQAPSLVSEIIKVSGCSEEQAADIYNRWRGKTCEGGNVIISGVGALNHKSFVMEQGFASAINPKGVKTIIIRRRSNKWLYALCAVCVVIALGFCAYIMMGEQLNLTPAKQSAAPAVVEQVAITDTATEVADSTAVTTAEGATESAAANAESAQTAQNEVKSSAEYG